MWGSGRELQPPRPHFYAWHVWKWCAFTARLHYCSITIDNVSMASVKCGGSTTNRRLLPRSDCMTGTAQHGWGGSGRGCSDSLSHKNSWIAVCSENSNETKCISTLARRITNLPETRGKSFLSFHLSIHSVIEGHRSRAPSAALFLRHGKSFNFFCSHCLHF